MNSEAKPELIARIYIDKHDDYSFSSKFADVAISFSAVHKGTLNEKQGPQFCIGYNDKLSSFEKMILTACMSTERELDGKAPSFITHNLMLDSRKNYAFDVVEQFTKSVRPVVRKAEKIAQDQYLDYWDYSGFAMSIITALNIKTVLFENYSETKGYSRWKPYPVSELTNLISIAKELALKN